MSFIQAIQEIRFLDPLFFTRKQPDFEWEIISISSLNRVTFHTNSVRLMQETHRVSIYLKLSYSIKSYAHGYHQKNYYVHIVCWHFFHPPGHSALERATHLQTFIWFNKPKNKNSNNHRKDVFRQTAETSKDSEHS